MFIQADALTAFTQRLICTKSITSREQEVVTLLATAMSAFGFDRVWVDEFGSAIGLIESNIPGPTLLLDGHCDTVDANSADWSRDPWSGSIQDGRLYGRGAADMKGSLAAMIHAVGAIDRTRLTGRVAVSATVSEETVEGGALKNVMGALNPDYVIIGEATQLNLNRGGRGRAEIRVTTYGRPAHSSSPQAGHCAVTDMVRIIQAVARQPSPEDPFLGPGSIVLTDIISEPHPGRSVIPYRCHVTYDRRLLPGEKKADVLGALESLPGLEDIQYTLGLAPNTEKTYTGRELSGEKYFPAWLLPEAHPFVQTALNSLRAMGLNPRIGAYRFCTNAAYSAGIAGVPTIGFGIGREEDAHIIDESISTDDLHTAAHGYLGIIQAVCGGK
jgi:putative selenium metabolism hydrolase